MFSHLKMEGHDLTWWEIDVVTQRFESKPSMTNWYMFKELIKSLFYLIGYGEEYRIGWLYIKQR